MQPVSFLTVLGVLAPLSLLAGAADTYPRRDLLVEPAELARPAAGTPPIVVDVRSRKEYDQGHVSGALSVDVDAWKKAFGDGKDAQQWGKRIGQLGIGSGSKVVVYDGKDANDAARIWWILRYWGLGDVRLLNGGWKGWEAAGLPVTTKPPAAGAPVAFRAEPQAARLATKSQLLGVLKGQAWQLVDARSSGEYCGIETHGNKRGGAIPGAKHLDWLDLIDKQTHRFKSPDDLRRLFVAAGIELGRPTAAYCQSGGRASVMAFALELMGARDVRNYYRSWHEWGNADDTPVTTPKPKS